MNFTSITKSFRGYHYQADWNSAEAWASEMTLQAKEHDEIEWSILVDTVRGEPIFRYRRGAPIEALKCTSV